MLLMVQKYFFLILIVFIVFLLFISKRLSKRTEFNKSKAEGLEKIYATYIPRQEISYDTFNKIYTALGHCYSIDPRLIRPEDPLSKFFKIDSWDLDEGTEKMNEFLDKTFGIRKELKIETVLDLLLAVEANKNK